MSKQLCVRSVLSNGSNSSTVESLQYKYVRLIADPNKLLSAVANISFRESEIINQEFFFLRFHVSHSRDAFLASPHHHHSSVICFTRRTKFLIRVLTLQS